MDKFKMNWFDIVNKVGFLEKIMNISKFFVMLVMKMKNKNVVVEVILKMFVGFLDNLELFFCLVSEELVFIDISIFYKWICRLYLKVMFLLKMVEIKV